MSVKLTTNLSQRLVLTPQLRQRIEMLQMTSLELGDLIQQQLLGKPHPRRNPAQDEKREIETEILDQLAGLRRRGGTINFEAVQPDRSTQRRLAERRGELPFPKPVWRNAGIFEGKAAGEEFGEESDPVAGARTPSRR